MKKALLLTAVLAITGLVVYMVFSKKSQASSEKKEAPMTVQGQSGAFNHSFGELMDAYYQLKDAFVEWDTAGIDHAAVTLGQKSDSLPLHELKTDSAIVETAANLAGSIRAEARGLGGETSIGEKRKSFNMITDELYSLIRTVRYDGGVIYHIRCPMAFNDSLEGFWLSASNKIVNPYLGRKHPVYKAKMLGCGEIIDSIQFARTQ